jgi:hypothetical protein
MIDPSRFRRLPSTPDQPTTRQAAQKRLLIIGGAAGGFLLVLLMIALAAGSGGKKKQARKDTTKDSPAAAKRAPQRSSQYEEISSLRSASRASRSTGPDTLADLMNQADELEPEADNTAGHLAVARRAMAHRNLQQAKRHVYTAVAKAKSSDETKEAERVEDLLKSLESFWKGVRAGAETKPTSMTQVTREQAVAWAQRGLKADTADLAIGAFLAIDAQGDRQEARARWEKAGDAGKALLPELDLPPPAANP